MRVPLRDDSDAVGRVLAVIKGVIPATASANELILADGDVLDKHPPDVHVVGGEGVASGHVVGPNMDV